MSNRQVRKGLRISAATVALVLAMAFLSPIAYAGNFERCTKTIIHAKKKARESYEDYYRRKLEYCDKAIKKESDTSRLLLSYAEKGGALWLLWGTLPESATAERSSVAAASLSAINTARSIDPLNHSVMTYMAMAIESYEGIAAMQAFRIEILLDAAAGQFPENNGEWPDRDYDANLRELEKMSLTPEQHSQIVIGLTRLIENPPDAALDFVEKLYLFRGEARVLYEIDAVRASEDFQTAAAISGPTTSSFDQLNARIHISQALYSLRGGARDVAAKEWNAAMDEVVSARGTGWPELGVTVFDWLRHTAKSLGEQDLYFDDGEEVKHAYLFADGKIVKASQLAELRAALTQCANEPTCVL